MTDILSALRQLMDPQYNPNWKGPDLDGPLMAWQVAQRQAIPLDYENMPASSQIDDRRGNQADAMRVAMSKMRDASGAAGSRLRGKYYPMEEMRNQAYLRNYEPQDEAYMKLRYPTDRRAQPEQDDPAEDQIAEMLRQDEPTPINPAVVQAIQPPNDFSHPALRGQDAILNGILQAQGVTPPTYHDYANDTFENRWRGE